MAFGTQDEPDEVMNEINMTPLVDVMLVLLIIFMVTAPLLVAGLPVDLPRSQQAQPVAKRPPVVVTVTRDGRTSIGDDEIAPDRLADAAREKLGDERDRPVYIRGDRDTRYGNVVAVIDRLTKGGIAKVVMLVERSPAGGGPGAPP